MSGTLARLATEAPPPDDYPSNLALIAQGQRIRANRAPPNPDMGLIGALLTGGSFQGSDANRRTLAEAIMRQSLGLSDGPSPALPLRDNQMRGLGEVDAFSAATVQNGIIPNRADDGLWDAVNRAQVAGGARQLDAERFGARFNQVSPEMFNMRMPNYGVQGFGAEPEDTWMGQMLRRNAGQRGRT